MDTTTADPPENIDSNDYDYNIDKKNNINNNINNNDYNHHNNNTNISYK